jgi:Flp pilus assembly protein TadD
LRPNGAEELYSYGLALLQLGDTDRAITELSRAKQLKPQDGKITAALERARAIANWRSK